MQRVRLSKVTTQTLRSNIETERRCGERYQGPKRYTKLPTTSTLYSLSSLIGLSGLVAVPNDY